MPSYNDEGIMGRIQHVPVVRVGRTFDTSNEKKKEYRKGGISGNKALMYASTAEIKAAVTTGRAIESVVEANRRGLVTETGKGSNAYRAACVLLGVSPIWSTDGRDDHAEDAPKQGSGDNRDHGEDRKGDDNQQPQAQGKTDLDKQMMERLGITAEVDQEALQEAAQQAVEEAKEGMVEDIREQVIQPVVVEMPAEQDLEPIIIDCPHESLEECHRVLMTHGQLWMIGPTGSGKSHIFRDLCKMRGIGPDKYRIIGCAATTDIYDLQGYEKVDGEFRRHAMAECYEEGYPCLLDEYDNLDPSTGVACNQALDGGPVWLCLQRTDNPVMHRSDSFLPVIATNTDGSGATAGYNGRQKIDAAVLSRFPAVTRVYVDYSMKVERAILAESQALCDWYWQIRKQVRDLDLAEERLPTTRDFISAAREIKARENGHGLDDWTIKGRFLKTWTEDERDSLPAALVSGVSL